MNLFIPIVIIPPLLFLYFRLRIRRLRRYKAKIGVIDVVETYDKERILKINTYSQGISINKGSVDKSYWYAVAKNAVDHCKNKKSPAVLFLGLGANTSSGLIARLNPGIHQTIVEIDPDVIQACREYFGLDTLLNAEVVNDDAFAYIKKAAKAKARFDVVVIDIFSGIAPFVVNGTEKPDFIKRVEKILKKDGIMIFNRPDDSEEARSSTKELIKYLKNHFKDVKDIYIHDPRGYRNNVIIVGRK